MAKPISADLEPVITRREEVGDVVVFDLEPAEGRRLPNWTPGAHLDVLMDAGVIRQYSLVGEVGQERWRLVVLREPEGRGGSEWLAGRRVGDRLRVAGPYNHFEFARGSAPVLLLAGGVGVAPISAMAAEARRTGRDYQLHYAGRDGHMALVEDLRVAHGERLHLHGGSDDRLDVPALLGAAAPGTVVYACGPARLLDEVLTVGESTGLEVHVERFEAIPLRPPVWTEPFEVELELSGLTVTVPPGRSILEVAEENGVPVSWSCTDGTCGTCETPVLEGEVDHRDSILTPEERARMDTMFICVSRAACPRLRLEL